MSDSSRFADSTFTLPKYLSLWNFTTTTPFLHIPSSELRSIFFAMEWYLRVIVNPIIGVFGIFGNVLSCVVLKRRGLHKSSDILLFTLSIVDTLVSTVTLDIARIATQIKTKSPLWNRVLDVDCSYTSPVGIMLYFSIISDAMYTFRIQTSSVICVYITVERFIAIFYPLEFRQIVTTKRVWIILAGTMLTMGVYAVNAVRNLVPFLEYDANRNVCFMHLARIQNMVDDMIDNIVYYACSLVAMIIVITGITAIGLKLIIVRKRRFTMTTSIKLTKSSLKTTKTLAAVCFLFSLTQIQRLPYTLDIGMDIEISDMYYQLNETLDYLNSGLNWLVYITLNDQFKNMMVEMLCCLITKK
ncbi:FMRFamide receptor-like [Physella acuta]|uniref:FMRFamide receptor-like n=1 Tax=Physella acuta TaxID=109671 RepID=UPI0027DDF613|nr:FMRFamide receptor-like [Physella acuta]